MDRLMLVDRWGEVRGHYNWTDGKELDMLKTKIDELLAETEPPKSKGEPKEDKSDADKPKKVFDEETGRLIDAPAEQATSETEAEKDATEENESKTSEGDTEEKTEEAQPTNGAS